jgi:hypothetical protein
VPRPGLTAHAVAGQLERGVRRHFEEPAMRLLGSIPRQCTGGDGHLS